jgi:hypothetical protein
MPKASTCIELVGLKTNRAADLIWRSPNDDETCVAALKRCRFCNTPSRRWRICCKQCNHPFPIARLILLLEIALASLIVLTIVWCFSA